MAFKVLTMVNINPLNTELNPICRLLALLGAHHILHVSRIRVNVWDMILFTYCLQLQVWYLSTKLHVMPSWNAVIFLHTELYILRSNVQIVSGQIASLKNI